MTDSVPTSRITQRLGFQIAFLLAVVLLPLTAMSVVRSSALVKEARARSEAALVGETMHAAARELQFIQEARGTVAALAGAIPAFVDDVEACSTIMREVATESARYSLVAFIPPDGIMRCSSSGKTHDFSDSSLWRQIDESPEPMIVVNRRAPVSGTSILGIAHPVFGEDGERLGTVSVSVPHEALIVPEPADSLSERPLEIVTFDAEGEILTASGWVSGYDEALPVDRSLKALTGEKPIAFTDKSVDGTVRVFSVVPLVRGELYALGTWPYDGTSSVGNSLSSVPFLFPVLMWLASLIVAWLAVERLVIRHIRKLRHSLISFAGGNRIVGDVNVSGAAIEIREIGEAYESMTETILHDEAELEDMVHQKEVLLREVHHRVKNNLQLIASIMNMQMRRTRSDEAKRTLKGLQDRVMSLATIHRELYQTAGLSDIHSDELLSTIVRQISNMTERPDRKFTVQTEFADIRMTPDQAVPLALLVAEAVTNAIKYAAGPDGGPAQLSVSLTRLSDTRAVVHVRNTVVDNEADATEDELDASGVSARTGLGTQLVSAFAMQLGGTANRTQEDGFHDLTVEFVIRPLADAEQRHAPDDDAALEPAG
ncbi:sensor histidine kinase [Defluviimonas aestuarii]|uniref:sensor histidine kinase n=1 Tax=Albidovulum aestuarii TaxID=1130726 RepID=UPI00249C2B43|nr:sensor histidine kinase [Defluviimonas aestuarii]MDI3335562.1 sensor histidine kinase [Defluviimonas aestuarii]